MLKILELLGFLFEYQTPRVVTIRHYKLGIFRLILQLCILTFIFVVQLWYKKGYQAFAEVEASVTTKVKGVAYSMFSESERQHKLSKEEVKIYERVWDVADFVIPPSENNAFFVLTNAIITINQTRNACPEDYTDMPDIICNKNGGRFVPPPASKHNNKKFMECIKGRISYYKSHGSETGRCIRHDRKGKKDDVHVCEVSGWCPVEQDSLTKNTEPLIPKTEYFTVLIKNAISFPRVHPRKYKRNNLANGVCLFDPRKETSWTCPIFRLGDIVALAEGNYTELATRGAVISIEIKWDCDLDFDFMKHCLPEYSFEILDDTGWNFRHALYHEEDRRTLIKAYGMKFLITVTGTARKFDITKTVVIIVTGLGLMGLANIMCDIVLLKSSNQYREKIAEKKYEMIEIKEEQSMGGLMRRLTLPYRNNSVMKNGTSPNLSPQTTTSTIESTPELNKKPNLQGQIDSLVDAL